MPSFPCIRNILEYAVAKEHQVHDFDLHLAQEEAQHKLKLEIEYDWITF